MIPLLFLGGMFTTFFVVITFGIYKSWYITRPMGTIFHPNMLFASLPFGLACLYGVIMPQLPNYTPESFHGDIFVGLALVGLVFMIWTPPFLKPWWIKMLEKEYVYCLPILIEEARRMGRWQWEARVRTPKQMQSWIDEVILKRKEDINQLWKEYQQHMRRKYGKGNYYVPEHRRKS